MFDFRAAYALMREGQEAAHQKAMQTWSKHSTGAVANPRRLNVYGEPVSGSHEVLSFWVVWWSLVRDGLLKLGDD